MGGAVYTTPIQPFRMYFHILSHPLPHTHTQIHVRTLNRSKLKNKNVLKNSRGRAPSRARIQHITNKQPSMYIYTTHTSAYSFRVADSYEPTPTHIAIYGICSMCGISPPVYIFCFMFILIVAATPSPPVLFRQVYIYIHVLCTHINTVVL